MRGAYVCISIVLALLLLSGCGREGRQVTLQPFIGGTEGLELEFAPDFRTEVRDGGEDSFDVPVWLENRGETLVRKGDIRVQLQGIKPEEFGKSAADLMLAPDEDLEPRDQDDAGNTIQGTRLSVEFRNLNHQSKIVGSQLTYPLRADICYGYRTDAVSKLCVRSDLLNPEPAGICDIEGGKEAYNSGAPVHVQSFREFKQSRDKVRFTFDVKHVGSGEVWTKGSLCEGDINRLKNRVIVTVDSNTPGLSCTGLTQASGTGVSGEVTLFDGVKTVSCTQELADRGNYEQRVDITLGYNYYDSQTTQLKVLTSGE